MNRSGSADKRGFSLLEVVIVVAIIAILAAIGIPRMSRGSRGANDSAIGGDLAVLRNAIDLYSAEHGGAFPTSANVVAQLTKYTDVAGATSDAKTTTHIYGPYIRSIPPLPIGTRQGKSGIGTVDGNDVGWIYTEASGKINANTGTTKDDQNRLYSEY
jgi:prepilin-type N-terminal cleavage/methylation domain-containing protein